MLRLSVKKKERSLSESRYQKYDTGIRGEARRGKMKEEKETRRKQEGKEKHKGEKEKIRMKENQIKKKH